MIGAMFCAMKATMKRFPFVGRDLKGRNGLD
jgi:hypothetical protein